MKKKISLIIGDQQYLNMLKMLFYYGHEYEIVAEHRSTTDAIKFAGIIPDLFIAEQNEIPSIQLINKTFGDVPLLIAVKEKTDDIIMKAMFAGASNAIFIGSTPAEYLQACKDILQGNVKINGSVSKKLLAISQGAKGDSNLTSLLTKREYDLLNLLKQGLFYKEIAVRFEISIETVKRHCHNIYRKLGVSNRTEAVNQLRSDQK